MNNIRESLQNEKTSDEELATKDYNALNEKNKLNTKVQNAIEQEKQKFNEKEVERFKGLLELIGKEKKYDVNKKISIDDFEAYSSTLDSLIRTYINSLKPDFKFVLMGQTNIKGDSVSSIIKTFSIFPESKDKSIGSIRISDIDFIRRLLKKALKENATKDSLKETALLGEVAVSTFDGKNFDENMFSLKNAINGKKYYEENSLNK